MFLLLSFMMVHLNFMFTQGVVQGVFEKIQVLGSQF